MSPRTSPTRQAAVRAESLIAASSGHRALAEKATAIAYFRREVAMRVRDRHSTGKLRQQSIVDAGAVLYGCGGLGSPVRSRRLNRFYNRPGGSASAWCSSLPPRCRVLRAGGTWTQRGRWGGIPFLWDRRPHDRPVVYALIVTDPHSLILN